MCDLEGLVFLEVPFRGSPFRGFCKTTVNVQMRSKYTHIYNKNIEALLDKILSEIKESVFMFKYGKDIEALVLGGGYARGDGGIIFDGAEAKLSNDLDFFIFLKSTKNRGKIIEFFKMLSDKYSEELDIEVDFDYPKLLSETKRIWGTMMFQEMLQSHIVVCGDGNILDNIPRLNFSKTLLSDAARLIMNRGVGLAIAYDKLPLAKFEKDFYFVARNASKAVLAAGDTELVLNNKYALNCDDRLVNLDGLSNIGNDLKRAYRNALEFKYSPKLIKDKKILESLLDEAERLWSGTARHIERVEFSPRKFLRRVCLNIVLGKNFRAIQSRRQWILKDPTLRMIEILYLNKCRVSDENFYRIWRRLS